jgi:hypothetical protein
MSINEKPDFFGMANEELPIEEEFNFLTPDEIEKLKKENMSSKIDDVKQVNTYAPLYQDPRFEKEVSITEAIQDVKRAIPNSDGKLKIELESCGRFDLPDTVFVEGYTFQDIQDLATSREEDILPNLVSILDKRMHGSSVSIAKATIEEFYEILLTIKGNFYTNSHTHHWMCDCQDKLPDNQKKSSSVTIDLKNVKFRSIIEAEDVLKKQLFEVLSSYTPDQYSQYLVKKYGSDIGITIDDEVNSFKIKEPLGFRDGKGNFIQTRLVRVEDLIFGYQVATRMFRGKIYKVRNMHKANMGKDQLEEFKADEMKYLEFEKSKKALLYTRAKTFLSINGKPFPSDEERIKYFLTLDLDTLNKYNSFLDTFSFGIYDELETECEFCGKTDRGYLQQYINPMEFIPLEGDKRDSADRKSRVSSITDFYFSN